MPSDIDKTINDVEKQLLELGYAEGSVALFRTHTQRLARYCRDNKKYRLTPEVIQQYICTLSSPGACSKPSTPSFRSAMRQLARFIETGIVPGRKRSDRWTAAPFFEKSLARFDAFARDDLGWSQCTRDRYTYWTRRLLAFARQRHPLKNWNSIRPDDLAEFLHQMPSRATYSIVLRQLRSALRTLFVLGELSVPIHERLPACRRNIAGLPLPAWKSEDFTRLLNAVDRSSALGRRDYAILLLAFRLGMRGVDIAYLRLDALRWESGQIEWRQRKTGVPIRLPLLPEIGDALIDYLRFGRPASTAAQIFLRGLAPFLPLSAAGPGTLIGRYQKKAGITPVPHRAFHALRRSLGVRLLHDDTSSIVIASCLGHRDPNVTRRYLPIDFSLLQDVALDPDKETACA